MQIKHANCSFHEKRKIFVTQNIFLEMKMSDQKEIQKKINWYQTISYHCNFPQIGHFNGEYYFYE